jgi:hypothetical protein
MGHWKENLSVTYYYVIQYLARIKCRWSNLHHMFIRNEPAQADLVVFEEEIGVKKGTKPTL